jgi:hypothetical protein
MPPERACIHPQLLLEAKDSGGTQYRKGKESIPAGLEQKILERFMSWASKFKMSSVTLLRTLLEVKRGTARPSGWYWLVLAGAPSIIMDRTSEPDQGTHFARFRRVVWYGSLYLAAITALETFQILGAMVPNHYKIGTLPRVGPVAQRLEQRTHNPLVLGSNPSGPTTAKKRSAIGRVNTSFCIDLARQVSCG